MHPILRILGFVDTIARRGGRLSQSEGDLWSESVAESATGPRHLEAIGITETAGVG
jgi:hypothetical protein